MEGAFIVAIGVLHIVALHKKWRRFMAFLQCRKMREHYDEPGFSTYVYVMCILVIDKWKLSFYQSFLMMLGIQ